MVALYCPCKLSHIVRAWYHNLYSPNRPVCSVAVPNCKSSLYHCQNLSTCNRSHCNSLTVCTQVYSTTLWILPLEATRWQFSYLTIPCPVVRSDNIFDPCCWKCALPEAQHGDQGLSGGYHRLAHYPHHFHYYHKNYYHHYCHEDEGLVIIITTLMMNIPGLLVAISGSAQGIGRALAEHLLTEGAKVIIINMLVL